MGGAISVIVAILAAMALFGAGRSRSGWTASVVAFICFWSWIHMWYFARILARNRMFVQALHNGEFKQGSPEAERFWRELRIQVEPIDARDVPDWITRINLVASVTGVALFIYGCVAYFR